MRRTLPSVMFATALGAGAAHAGPAPVIGGSGVAPGELRDVAGILDRFGDVFCTGTLVAPTVVLTAEHCIDGSLDAVLLDTNDWEQLDNAEVIDVVQKTGYPNGFYSAFDIGVLVLASPAAAPPTPIAAGWASLAIKNGAMATIAGYGAIDRDGDDYVSQMQKAQVPITDADCTTSAGCNSGAKPAGELGAGGMGVDTCQGDSGGPLFVMGGGVRFLAGVTSRGYDDNLYSCSEGGIYARPDKIIDWIETTAGVPVEKGEVPTWDELRGRRGSAVETRIEPNDPDSDEHTYEITTPPEFADARIRNDGTLRLCLDPDVTGPDEMVITITDASDASRSLLVIMPITIEPEAADGECDVDAFGDGGGGDGGCCDSGGNGGRSVPVGLALGALMLRRRRRIS